MERCEADGLREGPGDDLIKGVAGTSPVSSESAMMPEARILRAVKGSREDIAAGDRSRVEREGSWSSASESEAMLGTTAGS